MIRRWFVRSVVALDNHLEKRFAERVMVMVASMIRSSTSKTLFRICGAVQSYIASMYLKLIDKMLPASVEVFGRMEIDHKDVPRTREEAEHELKQLGLNVTIFEGDMIDDNGAEVIDNDTGAPIKRSNGST